MSNAYGLPVGTYRVIGAGRFDQLAGVGNPAPPPAYPSIPTRFVLVEGDGSTGATGRWEPPLVSKTPVTGYQVRVMLGETVLSSTSLAADVREFTTGYAEPGSFDFRVAAVNAAGPGDEASSRFVNEVEGQQPTEVTLPPGPVINLVAATPAVGSVRADWTIPAVADGRTVPTGYRVELLQSSLVVTRVEPVTATTHVFTGQAPGTYQVRVTALSALGDSAPVSSATVTLVASPLTPPLAPGSVTASLVGATVSVTYTAPAADAARAAVTGYRREFLRGTLVVATQESAALTGSTTAPADGTYTVRVTALSGAGPGPSATSGPVTYTAPVDVPDNPDVPPVPGAPSPRPASYPEFRLGAGDNRAGIQQFLNAQAESSGRAARLVGSGSFTGFITIPAALTYFRNSADELVISGEEQGHIRRHGVVTATASPITGGFTRGSDAITVQSAEGFSAGDKVYVSADDEFDHKPYKIGMRRRVVRIVGNVLELDLPLHRTGTINRRVRKVLPAGPIEFLWDGGPIRNSQWKGSQTLVSSDTGQSVAVSDDGDNFQQQMFTVAFVLADDVFAGLAGDPVHLDRCGAGFKTAAGVGGEYHLNIERIPDLTRDASNLAHWGYGLSEDGNRQTTYYLRSRWTRHAMTTQHNTWISQWDTGGISGLDGYGETEYCRFVYDVADTMSTGVNTHGGGYNNEHEGVIRDTGRWGNRAELKRDPTGLFFRSRRDHVGPAGLVLDQIATRTSTPWYSAITTAEKSSAAPSVFSLADGPVYSNLTLRRHNTKAGIRLKQPSTIGPNVTINMQGRYPGILVEPSAAGSRIVGPVTVVGGTAIVGAQYLSNADAITYA